MSVVSLVFAIMAGAAAALLIWIGAGSFWAAFAAYSLVGAAALVGIMTIRAFCPPLPATLRSPRVQESP